MRVAAKETHDPLQCIVRANAIRLEGSCVNSSVVECRVTYFSSNRGPRRHSLPSTSAIISRSIAFDHREFPEWSNLRRRNRLVGECQPHDRLEEPQLELLLVGIGGEVDEKSVSSSWRLSNTTRPVRLSRQVRPKRFSTWFGAPAFCVRKLLMNVSTGRFLVDSKSMPCWSNS